MVLVAAKTTSWLKRERGSAEEAGARESVWRERVKDTLSPSKTTSALLQTSKALHWHSSGTVKCLSSFRQCLLLLKRYKTSWNGSIKVEFNTFLTYCGNAFLFTIFCKASFQLKQKSMEENFRDWVILPTLITHFHPIFLSIAKPVGGGGGVDRWRGSECVLL